MKGLREIPQKRYVKTLPDGFEITKLYIRGEPIRDYLQKIAETQLEEERLIESNAR